MITSKLKYTQQSKNTIKLKRILNGSLVALATVLITFTILFMVLAFKEKNTLGFYNLFFSVVCIILQIFLILIVAYDFYYLNKVEKIIDKTGSYEIPLSKPINLTNKKFKNSTYVIFGISILALLAGITSLILVLIQKNFYDSFVSIIAAFNCFIYIMFCLTACGYSDLLHYNTYQELEKLNIENNNSFSEVDEATEVFNKNKTIVTSNKKINNKKENLSTNKTNTKNTSLQKSTTTNEKPNANVSISKNTTATKTATKKTSTKK